ncbi:MAG TPA: dihydrolipoyl dehydrogenase [Anaerolineae bacterium]|nr:dihydrolipoyl dehydrogenase [Anaerolineae bacterium]HQK12390.1 dihydrolipoyl dehydrogenase [Anaerolineae bacterium]
MSEPTYDVVIIGAGPGGYVAAIRAAQLGMKVALVEREHLGGVCLNWGCIPTKSLLRNAEIARLLGEGKEFGFSVENITLDYGAAVDRSRKVAARLVKGVEMLMKGNHIDVVWGNASLASPTSVVVTGTGDAQTLAAKAVIIATGSRARLIPGITADGERVLTARQALERRELPKSAVIIGAGPIGLEFATVWRSYGATVTVVEMLEHILPAEDKDAAEELARQFRRQRIQMLTSTRVEGIETTANGVNVRVSRPKAAASPGESSEQTLAGDVALVAIGVQPNSEDLGLEAIGVATERGWIKVDGFMRTNIPTVYAIGDVNGLLPLAHVASAQGILAVETIAGHKTRPFDVNAMPRATYTSPQVASFGLSEAKAKEAGRDVRVGTFPFLANGKALGMGENVGMVKIVADAVSGEILGAVIVGPEATELIAELVLAHTAKLTPDEIARTVHAHPTLSEAVMEAAHGVFGKAIHNV